MAHFPSTQASAAEMYVTFWEGVKQLTLWGFSVTNINIDGASTNKAFLKMHFPEGDRCKVNMIACNPCNPCTSVIFVMGYSHVIKKFATVLSKVVWGNIVFSFWKLEIILWQFCIDAFNWDQTNPLEAMPTACAPDFSYEDETCR